MKKKRKILIINIIILLIINLLTNYKSILTIFNNPKEYTKNSITNYSNVRYEINNINQKVNMLEINFKSIPNMITISYTNDNRNDYIHFNASYNNSNIKENKLYIPAAIDNNTKKIAIDSVNGEIDKIIINPKIKYKANILQTLSIYLTIVIINYILFKNNYLNIKNKQQQLITSLTIITLIIIAIIFYINYCKKFPEFGDLYEYYYVNSIIDGKLNLDYPVDENLLNSPNPYDTSNRNFKYLWDASFYKGKYYCYFGILPAITLLVPFKLLTNNYLTTESACLIYCIFAIIGTFKLFDNVIKKYFKNISFQTYIISFLFIIFGSKLFWCMYRPSFYELVCIAAYTHTIFGLDLVLFSDKRIKNFIGYTLLALTALCRPTFLLYSILIVPKLIDKFKKKQFKLPDLLILVIPYLIIGLITMYLNFIRFDSVLEFGTSYQLTVNNLTSKQFSLYNGIFGLYNYLFESISISLFPLKVTETLPKVSYITEIYIEYLGGGIISTSIIGIIIFFIPKIFKYIKEKELKTYIILSLITSISLIILSSSMSALIGRYMIDFNFIFYFITVILSLYIMKIHKHETINKIYIALSIISILINLLITELNIY